MVEPKPCQKKWRLLKSISSYRKILQQKKRTLSNSAWRKGLNQLIAKRNDICENLFLSTRKSYKTNNFRKKTLSIHFSPKSAQCQKLWRLWKFIPQIMKSYSGVFLFGGKGNVSKIKLPNDWKHILQQKIPHLRSVIANIAIFSFVKSISTNFFSAKAPLSRKYKKYAAAQNITGFSQKAVTCGSKNVLLQIQKNFC